MLKIQKLTEFFGFGSGQKRGEYHFSQNFKRVQEGLAPAWKLTQRTSTNLIQNLGIINWFAERNDSLYGVSQTGVIYKGLVGSDNDWIEEHNPGLSSGQGLITDPVNRLLYIRND